jgi:hypothetical protein
MKEGFFYKKDVLLRLIRTPKEYPYVQIYSALTYLIEDENEFITDKYGRNGRLVNIGEYYLFQPIELRDKNISIFERSVPIDYKHSAVNFKLNKDINAPQPGINLPPINENVEGKKVLEEIIINYNIAKEFINQQPLPRKEDNWYKHCGIIMGKLLNEYPEINNYVFDFLIAHIIELLFYNDKLNLLKYIYSLENIPRDTIEWNIKKYFEKYIIVTEEITAILMYNLSEEIYMILKDNTWTIAEPEDIRDIVNSPSSIKFNTNEYNPIIGFIGLEKNNKYNVFKTINISVKRNKGARCDESGKPKVIQKLNDIHGEEKYNISQKEIKELNIVELCIMLEFILRYYDEIQKNNKKWFLTPELALKFNLYTVTV